MAEITETLKGNFKVGSAVVGRVPRVERGRTDTDLESSPFGGSTQVTITSAEVLDLAATPVTLVPAPGAGKALQFLGAILALDFAETAYAEDAGGSNFAIKETDESGAKVSNDIEVTGFIEAEADKIIQVVPIKDALLTENTPLVLHNIGSGDVVTGDSPLIATVFYAVHETGLEAE